MIRPPFHRFPDIEDVIRGALIDNEQAKDVDVGWWHAMDVRNQPRLITRELQNVIFEMYVPSTIENLQEEIQPNLPWAEDHFKERVSGEPLNPGEQYKNWPWYKEDYGHREGGQFSHTYMERMWPKHAGPRGQKHFTNTGLRFKLGDLDDVVVHLNETPHSRQAYLPIWFPEDTGVVHKERVPCTLGYHFLIREGNLNVTYLIRSCDFLRYFRDDVYMACRLGHWMIEQLDTPCSMGTLTFHAMSFHVFQGDMERLKKDAAGRATEDREKRAMARASKAVRPT